MRKVWLLVPLALLALAGWQVTRGGGSAKQPAEKTSSPPPAAKVSDATPVQTVVVEPERFVVESVVTGNIVAHHDTTISAKAGGRLVAVLVDEGQSVRAGQVVARLDDAELQAQLRQSQAQLAAQQTRLQQTRTQVGAAETRVSQAGSTAAMTQEQVKARLRQAEAQLSQAKARLQQAETVAATTPEETSQAVAQAEANLAAARKRVEILERGGREEERRQAAAQVSAAQASVKAAQAEYDEAAREARRFKALVDDGAAAQADLDLASTRAATAKARLEAAQHQLTVAQQQQAIVTSGARAEEIAIAREQVKAAEAAVALARAGRSRNQTAAREVEAWRAQVAQAEAAVAAAKADLAQAKLRQQDVDVAANAKQQQEQTVEQQQAAIAAAQAGIDLLTTRLQDMTITAPRAGIINHRFVESGEVVAPGQPLFSLLDDASIYFEASVSERDLPAFRRGQTMTVTVDAFPGRQWTGAVTDILPGGNVQNRNFVVKVLLPNRDGQLRQGMFARATVTAESASDALLAPGECVLYTDGEAQVAVVEDGVARLRQVELGRRQQGRVRVLSGLSPGDRIIVRGQHQVRDGDAVREVEAGADPAQTPDRDAAPTH